LVNVGDLAPDFTLQADDSRKVSLKDFRGKTVILYFYPKDVTPGCTTEALGFKEAVKDFERQGVVILGLSKDTVESHRKFKEKYELPFTLLSDPETQVLNLYGVWKQKNLYGRTFMGTERSTFVIDPEGRIKKLYRKVKPKEHAQTCLLDLKASQ
jgi:thioredoxin-dependent peroxiredoxin